MSEHLSLETCKRLKEAGYPQDSWPQMVWTRGNVGDWVVAGVMTQQEWSSWHLKFPVYACPPIITADGNGGVLPWLESLGFHLEWSGSPGNWWRYRSPVGTVGSKDSPEWLIVAALDALAAQHPAPDAPQAVRE